MKKDVSKPICKHACLGGWAADIILLLLFFCVAWHGSGRGEPTYMHHGHITTESPCIRCSFAEAPGSPDRQILGHTRLVLGLKFVLR